MANCCCPHSLSAGKFFSFFARSYRKRFAKKGFEPSQQQLLDGIDRNEIRNSTILEIGSGVGHLHQSLLEQGAASAVGIDLASQMTKEAQQWAKERGLQDRTDYLTGDYMSLHNQIIPADVTIMDKVVCCYPDAYGLVTRSLHNTKKIYALTYPKDKWFIRFAVALTGIILKLFGSSFRPYVHSPQDVELWINQHGFKKSYQNTTFVWLTQVFVRA